MTKFLPLLLLTLTLALTACGPSAEKLNNSGNEAYNNQDYAAALTAYQQAEAKSPELAEPLYNAANTYYRQENFEQAQQEAEQTLLKAKGKLTEDSLYNLGNTLFQKKEFQTAIESYKEALRLNPADVEAKENLELALKQLQQQQQEQQQQDQQQQDQQQQDQQQNDGQSQDQQQQQSNEPQQQSGQPNDQQQNEGQQNDQQSQQGDQQDQKQQNGTQQDQAQARQPGDQQQPEQSAGQPQQVEGLTKEQARQLFEAATQGTKSLEEYLQQQTQPAPQAPVTEDW